MKFDEHLEAFGETNIRLSLPSEFDKNKIVFLGSGVSGVVIGFTEEDYKHIAVKITWPVNHVRNNVYNEKYMWNNIVDHIILRHQDDNGGQLPRGFTAMDNFFEIEMSIYGE